MQHPFAGMRPHAYGLIMADPPWRFATWSDKGHGKSPQRHYACMDLDAIKALPVAELAAPDCALFLWATWPMIESAFDVMAAWGFAYKTGGCWHKRTRTGKTAFGTGYRARCACEPFLLGFRGNPKNSRGERNLIEGVVREHSRKPEDAYAWCERYLPGVARAELFSRAQRPGWDAWGDQAGLFTGASSDAPQTRPLGAAEPSLSPGLTRGTGRRALRRSQRPARSDETSARMGDGG